MYDLEPTLLGLWQQQQKRQEWRGQTQPVQGAEDPSPRRFRHRVGLLLITAGQRLGGQGEQPLPHGGESFA